MTSTPIDSAPTERPTYAVLGTGSMGSAVARALRESGTSVTVWNRSKERALSLADDGISIASSPAEAIAAADLILVTLTSPEATKDVLSGQGVDAAVRGRTLIEFSVGNPANRIALEAWCAERGATYLAGGIKAATFEVGTEKALIRLWGSREVFERTEPALSCLGRLQYLSADIAAEETLAVAGPPMTMALAAAFMEAATFLAVNGVPVRPLLAQLESTYKLATTVAHHVVARLEAGEDAELPFEASLETWVNSVTPLVEVIRASGIDPMTLDAGLGEFRLGIESGYGKQEIVALIKSISEGRNGQT